LPQALKLAAPEQSSMGRAVSRGFAFNETPEAGFIE